LVLEITLNLITNKHAAVFYFCAINHVVLWAQIKWEKVSKNRYNKQSITTKSRTSIPALIKKSLSYVKERNYSSVQSQALNFSLHFRNKFYLLTIKSHIQNFDL